MERANTNHLEKGILEDREAGRSKSHPFFNYAMHFSGKHSIRLLILYTVGHEASVPEL